MDNKTKATENQMIEEAIFRMKSLGFPQPYIDAFATDNAIRRFVTPSGESDVIDEWEDNLLSSYERPYGGYPWCMIKEESPIWEFDRVDTYYLLFVSPDLDQWETERAELAAMEPTVFMICYNYSLEEEENEFVKKAIRLTPDGALVLAKK